MLGNVSVDGPVDAAVACFHGRHMYVIHIF
jgi:hypothetical protein